MKKSCRDITKLFSLLMVLAVVLSSYSPLYSDINTNASAETNAVFDISLVSGAEKKGDKYIWTADNNQAGHRFKFRITYTLSGEGQLDQGDIQITVPKHIIKDRAQLASGSSEYSDVFDLSVPHESEAVDRTDFAYREDGDNLVIYNYKSGMEAAQKGYIEIAYETTEDTFAYEDMAESDAFSASLSYTNAGSTITKDSRRLTVAMDTTAEAGGTKVADNSPVIYKTWNSEWGEEPSGADDNYYLLWAVISDINNVSQPYNFTLNSNVSSTFGEGVTVVGYKMAGSTEFSSSNVVENLTRGPGTHLLQDETGFYYRTDYVLTSHPKASFQPLAHYRIDNVLTAIVDPVDHKQDPTSSKTSDYYIYDRVYAPPGGFFQVKNCGNSNWINDHYTPWQYADYGLNDLQEGLVSELDKNIKFHNELYGYPYPYTLPNGMSPKDQSSAEYFGTNKVKYILTNDIFYVNDDCSADQEGKITLDKNARQLDVDDYEICQIYYSYGITNKVFDSEDLKFVYAPSSYADDDILYFQGKYVIGGEKKWVDIASYNCKTKEVEFDSNYVDSMTASCVKLKGGCIGYKITTETAHYYALLSAYPYIRVKNSPFILEQFEGKEKVHLTSIDKGEVYTKDGYFIFSKESMSRDYIVGVKRELRFQKRVKSLSNNKVDRLVNISWNVTLNESAMTNDGMEEVTQQSGVFYDLIPKGATIDTETVMVFNENSEELAGWAYDVSTIPNYKGSDRTLLIVKVKQPLDAIKLVYTTTHTWESLKDFGIRAYNSTAYETGNDFIATGRPDDGGAIQDKDVLRDLDETTDDRRFVYTQYTYIIDIVTAATTGLSKEIISPSVSEYGEEAFVYQNQIYSYKLHYHTDIDAAANDIVIYDSLENYSPDGNNSDWHGTLSAVGLTQPISMGAAPIVYYSKIQSLDVSQHYDLNDTINGEKVWLTESEIGDISQATAIAIDLRKDQNGDNFVLDQDQSMSIYVYMKAPPSIQSESQDPKAYNGVWAANTITDIFGGSTWGMLHYDYTTAHYRVASDLRIYKSDSSDSTKPVEGISFCLEGTSDYGTGISKILTTDSDGYIKFAGIEKGSYWLYECEGSRDYHAINEFIPVEVTSDGTLKVNGKVVAGNEYYNIPNDPRIHADVKFYKVDSLNTSKGIQGVKFKLSGRSDYGNDVIKYAVSAATGLVQFVNVELGKYDLVEITTPDGYIPNKTKYEVVVDGEGIVSITNAYTGGRGDIYIYNEPYHTVTFFKLSSYNQDGLGGAVFSLKGASDYGHSVDMQAMSEYGSGKVTFNNLEPGAYILREVTPPEGFIGDDKEYPVIVRNRYWKSFEIEGLETPYSDDYVFYNDPNGTVKITKKWEDNADNAERPTPVVHIKSSYDESEAYFKGDLEIKNVVSGIQTFTKCSVINIDGVDTAVNEEVLYNLSGINLFRVDDDTTGFKIFIWYDQSAPHAYWWSEAKNVYVRNPKMFNGLSRCTELNLSGISFARMNADDYTVGLGIAYISESVNGSSFSTAAGNVVADSTYYKDKKVTSVKYNTYLFLGCTRLEILNLSGCDLSKLGKDMNHAFYNNATLREIDLSNANLSQVISMHRMFGHIRNLTTIKLNNVNTYNNTDIGGLFVGCGNLANIELDGFDTSCVTDMSMIFRYCRSLRDVDLTGLDTTGVTDMNRMFDFCTELLEINLTNFDTSAVVNMAYMFCECRSLQSLDLSSFNTSSVMNMYGMFYFNSTVTQGQPATISLTELDLSSFDTTNVLAMNQMFYGFKSLEVLDLTNFNVRSNASITNMFYGCTNLTTIYCGYSWSLSSNAAIFQNCTNLVGGNGTAFSQRKITSSAYAKMDGVGSLGYFTQKNPTIEIRGNCSFTLTNTIVSKRQSVRDTKMYFLVSFSGAGSVPAQDMNRQPVESNGDMLLFELSNGESVTINHLVNSQNPIIQILYDYNGTDPTYWTNGFRQKIGSYGMAALGGARISNFNTSDYDLFAYDQLNKGNVSSSDVATVSINRSTARIANGFGLPAVAFTANFPNVVMSNLMVDDNEEEDEPDKEWITYSSLDQNDQGEDICEIDKNAGENEWTYTFKGLDPRLVFYAWEDTVGLDDYVISNTEDNVVKAVGGIATITNTSKTDPPTYGDLKITKSVEPDHASITITNEDKQKLFRFKVTLKDAEGKPLSGLRIYGNTVFQNGVGTALLSHGQSVEFNDIPTGYRYSVEEIEEDGFYNLSDNETGVIAADQTSTAAFMNVKNYVEPEPADTTSFKLRKKLVGNFQDSSAPFDFEVMFEGLESGKSYVIKVESSDVPYKEVSYTSDAYGSALVDLQLPHGSEAEFADIPLGSRYKIEEAAGEYTSSYRITDSQENVENRGSTIVKTDQSNSAENKALATAWETADKDEVITVLYTNRKYAREDLVVRKEIENSSSSNSDVFEFNILLSNLNANELIKTSVGKQKADSEGQLSIQFFMSNGDETLFYDLPVGTKYTVTESQSNYIASYRISDENSLGKIVSQTGENVLDKTDLSTEEETVDEGESAVVTFVNKKVTRDVKITNVVDALYSEIPSEVYKNQDFGFKMEMSGLDHNTKYVAEYTNEAVSGKTESSYYSDDNGKLTVEFTLKDGHSINFINLPKGANYQITEYAAEDYVSSYSTKLSSKAHAAMEQSENTLKNTELKTEVETVDADETYDDMEVTFIFKNTVPITHYVLPDSGMKNRIPLMTGAAFGCIFFAAVYLYQCMKRRSSV